MRFMMRAKNAPRYFPTLLHIVGLYGKAYVKKAAVTPNLGSAEPAYYMETEADDF